MPDQSEPLAPLTEEAVRWHEAYESFRVAGFADDEALRIVIALIINAISGADQ